VRLLNSLSEHIECPQEADHSARAAGRPDSTCGRTSIPAAITVVTAGDHLLLGDQSRWIGGRYSLLAGAQASGLC
jgi:NADH pyrophosphatase NudC (nudix superfamily)